MKITKDINPAIFREYDVRAIYDKDLDEDVAYTIGKAFGSYVRKLKENINEIINIPYTFIFTSN